VFFWFIGGAFLAIWLVLHDPQLDYRLLALGAILPDLVDPFFGGARVLHSITFSVLLLAVVVLATNRRSPVRRRLLALVFGTFMHLVLDGAFTDNKVFWWPFFGWSFGGARLPSIARGWIDVLLEVIGVAILVWAWRRFRLDLKPRRQQLLRQGTLVP
jgi:hypothetical protein